MPVFGVEGSLNSCHRTVGLRDPKGSGPLAPMCSITQVCHEGSWSSWDAQLSISWAYWQLMSRVWEHSVFHGTHWFWWPWILQAPNTHPVQAQGASSTVDQGRPAASPSIVGWDTMRCKNTFTLCGACSYRPHKLFVVEQEFPRQTETCIGRNNKA